MSDENKKIILRVEGKDCISRGHGTNDYDRKDLDADEAKSLKELFDISGVNFVEGVLGYD